LTSLCEGKPPLFCLYNVKVTYSDALEDTSGDGDDVTVLKVDGALVPGDSPYDVVVGVMGEASVLLLSYPPPELLSVVEAGGVGVTGESGELTGGVYEVAESGGESVVGRSVSVIVGESEVVLGASVVAYVGVGKEVSVGEEAALDEVSLVGGRYVRDVGVKTGTLSVVVPTSEVDGPEPVLVVGVGTSEG
jgi:hypothetical protein